MPETQQSYAFGVRRIAILRALYLGDLLITTPAWRALRRRFPRAEITLIGLPGAAEFSAHVPDLIDRLVLFPGYPGIPEVPYEPARTTAFLEEQRAYGYDLALQMHGDGRASNGLVAGLGAGLSLGYARAADNRLDIAAPYDPDANEVRRWLDLVALLGAPAVEPRIEFAVSPAERARARALLRSAGGGRPLVGLHAGAKDPARRWPPERFAQLGRELHALTAACVVLTGAAAERPLAAAVGAGLDGPVIDLCGQTSLGELAAVIAELDLLVTNDTGASHMAAAVGTPSVVLFGPTRPAQFAPPDATLHRALDAREHARGAADGAAALAALPAAPALEAALAQLGLRFSAAALREREVA